MATSRSVKDIARALVAVAAEERVVAEVLQDLKAVLEAFRLDPYLAIDLNETCVPLERRQEAVRKAIGKKVHPFILHTVLALQKRGLLEDLALVRAAAVKEAELVAEHREALVITALALTEREKEQIRKNLEKRFGGTVTVEERIDATVLGGLRIEIGDWKIDDSIAGKLERLTHALYV